MKLSIATTRQENLLGYIYLGFSHFLLSALIAIVAYLWGYPISVTSLNIIYFVVNFISVVAIFHRFLARSLQTAWKNIPKCLFSVVVGFGIDHWGTILVGLLIARINSDFANVNGQAVTGMIQESPLIMGMCTVFFVPVVEETLYRGLIFQQLQRKHRALAYVVSIAVFSTIHIAGFIGSVDWLTLLLCFMQYIPAGIALAWAYEQADTIIAPILVHMIVNQIALTTMR